MKIYYNKQIDEINVDESFIESISWENSYKDIRIEIDWCGQENLKDDFDFNKIKTCFLFEMASDVEFRFKFSSDKMGGMEISKFEFKPLNNRFLVQFVFDFYPEGIITLTCDNMSFIVEDKE